MNEQPHISGRTRVFGLIGHPVRQSLSPEMHTALFARLGLDAVYVAFDVAPDAADQVASAVRTLDLVGVNLTVPFKERVLPHLDDLTQAAEEAGAVNVVTNIGGFLTGYNTDGEGLVRSLEEEHAWHPRGLDCVVLGAGGTGRAVAASLGAGGARSVTLLNRTLVRAEQAVTYLRDRMSTVRFTAGPLEAPVLREVATEAHLVVNCLNGAGAHRATELPVEVLSPDAVWVDVNYWMDEPPQLAASAARGLRTSNGVGMLVHQGALSFELFTGHPIEVGELRRILGRQGLR